jgi:hypothetical protein
MVSHLVLTIWKLDRSNFATKLDCLSKKSQNKIFVIKWSSLAEKFYHSKSAPIFQFGLDQKKLLSRLF